MNVIKIEKEVVRGAWGVSCKQSPPMFFTEKQATTTTTMTSSMTLTKRAKAVRITMREDRSIVTNLIHISKICFEAKFQRKKKMEEKKRKKANDRASFTFQKKL